MGIQERIKDHLERVSNEWKRKGYEEIAKHVLDGSGRDPGMMGHLENATKVQVLGKLRTNNIPTSVDIKKLPFKELFVEYNQPPSEVIGEDGQTYSVVGVLIVVKEEVVDSYFFYSDKEHSFIRFKPDLSEDFIFSSFCKHKAEHQKDAKDCGYSGFLKGNFCTYIKGSNNCQMGKNYSKLRELLIMTVHEMTTKEMKKVKIPEERNKRRIKRQQQPLKDYLLLKI